MTTGAPQANATPVMDGTGEAVVVIAGITPKPGHLQQVISAFAAGIGRVHRQDVGCDLYALHEDGDRLVMIEKWSSRAAFEAHMDGQAVADLAASLHGLLAEDSVPRLLRPLPHGEDAQGRL